MPPRTKPETQVEITAFHTNTSQEVITITSDRLELTLTKHVKRIVDGGSWQVPLAFLLSMIPLFSTADFKSVFGVTAEGWKSGFILLTIIFLGWFLLSLVQVYNRSSIRDLINEIKSGSD